MLPRWVKDYGIVAVVAVVVVGWFGTRTPEPVPQGPAPDFRLTRTDGQVAQVPDASGKPAVVVFWAEWCGACKQQVDDVNRLYVEHGDDVQIIGIAMDSGDSDSVARHARRHGIDFPVAAATSAVVSDYGVTALPTNVFVDGSGAITDSVVGTMDYAAFSRRLP